MNVGGEFYTTKKEVHSLLRGERFCIVDVSTSRVDTRAATFAVTM